MIDGNKRTAAFAMEACLICAKVSTSGTRIDFRSRAGRRIGRRVRSATSSTNRWRPTPTRFADQSPRRVVEVGGSRSGGPTRLSIFRVQRITAMLSNGVRTWVRCLQWPQSGANAGFRVQWCDTLCCYLLVSLANLVRRVVVVDRLREFFELVHFSARKNQYTSASGRRVRP